MEENCTHFLCLTQYLFPALFSRHEKTSVISEISYVRNVNYQIICNPCIYICSLILLKVFLIYLGCELVQFTRELGSCV